MGGLSFLEKQRQKQELCFKAGCDLTAQQFFDFLCIVLNDPKVMGKDVLGRKRLHKVMEALKEVDRYYSEAFVNGVDSDYYQEKLDGELRRIFGETDPFAKRYPFLKQWNYNKPYKERK